MLSLCLGERECCYAQSAASCLTLTKVPFLYLKWGGGGVSISLNKESNDLYQNTKFLILFLKIMVYFDEEINVLQKLYQTLLRFAVWIKNSQWRFI